MANAFPAIQINTVDPATNPAANIMAQVGGLGLVCSKGVLMQDVTLAAASSNVALAFPTGVTTAVFIFIAALTTTDLIVKVGGTPISLSVPIGQGMMLYGLTSANVSLSTALGGQVQYAVGG